MAAESILIVEDEEILADTIRYNLELEGYRVEVVGNGGDALARFTSLQPDLVVLDVMLPTLSGLDVCRELRARSTVPILMLTARGDEADRVVGLELGADDYLTKPFSLRELIARVRAQLRRADMARTEETRVLRGGRVEMDLDRHEVRVAGELVGFAPKEFELLAALLRRQGRLATRETLLDEVWGFDFVGDTKTLDVHIKRIRGKIEEDAHRPRQILTVRGLGYKFADDPP